jgi:hypothetical protein
LDVRGGPSAIQDGADVQQYTNFHNGNQRWLFVNERLRMRRVYGCSCAVCFSRYMRERSLFAAGSNAANGNGLWSTRSGANSRRSYALVAEPVATSTGTLVSCLDHHRQRHHNRGRRIEIVGVALQPGGRRYPGDQLVRIDGLLQVIIGSGPPPGDSAVPVAEGYGDTRICEGGDSLKRNPIKSV